MTKLDANSLQCRKRKTQHHFDGFLISALAGQFARELLMRTSRLAEHQAAPLGST